MQKLLAYNLETGVFTWLQNRSRGVKTGDVAGSKMADGYTQIRINGKHFLAHRLAWFYAYGAWPDKHIDHINRNKSDNRLSNLRQATPSQNAQNRSVNARSSTGLKGVTFHKRDKKYQAAITLNGCVKHLGYFDDGESAHAAYVSASISNQSHSAFLGTA